MLLKKTRLIGLIFLLIIGNSSAYFNMPNLLKPNIVASSNDKLIRDISGISINAAIMLFSIFIEFKMIAKMLEEPGFKVYQPGEVKEKFSNVAGTSEAKELFNDIVEYLKNPEVYKAIGAKPTTGILLTGGPGTGKTLLARAIAGEANCAFIYASGSEFNGKFVGSGVERIKKLFNQARSQCTWTLKKVPCIIFIDEFEVLAKQRGSTFDNFSDQTVNELLTQLDGFVKNQDTPVIVIAATNYPDKIDKAILRPGRIDRTIHVNSPDYQDRLDILQIHLNKVVHDKDKIKLDTIAQQTIGFSGAELEGIINSAARLAVNRNASEVSQEDIQEAYELRVIGASSKRVLTQREKEIVAYHEAGHALSSMLLMPNNIVNKITILPRGQSLGVTHFLPKNEIAQLQTKQDYLNRIAMLLAGRAAEDIIFNVITTGPSDDLRRATELVEIMLKYYGMGNSLVVETNFSGNSNKIEVGEVAKVLDAQYERVKDILKNKIDSLTILSKKLLEKGTLVKDEIEQLHLV